MKLLKKNFLFKSILVVFIISFFIGCDNFHEVSKGKLYRSRQLNAKKLDFYIHKYGIKTVINLRGSQPDEKWYEEEIAEVKKNEVQHYDFNLSATRYVPHNFLDSIIEIASAAPKPILVHCKAGADRTGLFCAVWQYEIDENQPEIASKQLSLSYGHIPFLIWKKTEAMDSSFIDFVRKDKYQQIIHDVKALPFAQQTQVQNNSKN
jgi:undecaprenyl-diphosphatase